MLKAILAFFLLAVSSYAQAATHSATLTWTWTQTGGDPATGFHVQRSQVSGGPYTVVGTVSSVATLTYTDTTVAGGQTYYYVVTAFNSGGDSAPSNQATGVIPFQAPSPGPAGLTITVK